MSILINVSIKLQQLTLVEHTKVIKSYSVSTSLKGIGQNKNSFKEKEISKN